MFLTKFMEIASSVVGDLVSLRAFLAALFKVLFRDFLKI